MTTTVMISVVSTEVASPQVLLQASPPGCGNGNGKTPGKTGKEHQIVSVFHLL